MYTVYFITLDHVLLGGLPWEISTDYKLKLLVNVIFAVGQL